MKIISIKDLQNTDKIERLCKNNKESIFVEQGGDIKFVIFDFDYYYDLISKLNEAKLVNEGLEDLQNGKVADGKAVKDKIKKKF
ncbi:MAG: type II toxin-antitoxin system Phd/YefM family antitoxin [Clostridia bacterium]|nr:type II toxin-antitoxin system Phd/YefM family antitoxin [Clostridia bacterium]